MIIYKFKKIVLILHCFQYKKQYMKIKISWGTGLLITIITFVTFLVSFALFSLTQTVNLVSKDYFPEEIAYSTKLEKLKNTDKLKEKITIEQIDNQITINFPKEFENKEIKGKIKFYYITNFKFDVNMKVNLNNNKQIINIKQYKKGRYFIQIDWKVEGKTYFQEFDINI